MTSQTGDLTSIRFSTNALPERDRLAGFREHFGRMVVGLDFEPMAAAFRAEMTVRALPGLQIISAVMSAARHARTLELTADGNDDFCLVAPNCALATVLQLGKEIPVSRGDAVLIRACNVSTFIRPSRLEFIGLRIPSAVLARLVANVDDALVRPIPRSTEALKLLISYVTLLKRDGALATPEVRHLVATHVHDLAALAIGATRDAASIAEGRGLRAARLRAIKADILDNLHHSNLTVAATAKRHGVTPRYVQLLFEAEGTSFSQFVCEQRLLHAHRWLADPRRADQAISNIAYTVGFGDLSYFNRAFRQRFGVTPSEVRGD